MKLPPSFVISASVTLVIGAVIFMRQTSQLADLQTHAASTIQVAPARHPNFSPPITRSWPAPPPRLPEPDGALLDRLSEKMVALLDLEAFVASLGHKDASQPGRIILAANLNEVERAAFEKAFNDSGLERLRALTDPSLTETGRSARLTEISAKLDTWIAGQLSPGPQQAVKEAETSAARARAERNATNGVSRISRAADLTDAQKDTLYAAFLDHAQRPEAAVPSGLSMVLLPFGHIQEEPPVPDLLEEARTILTPPQWSQYENHRKLPTADQVSMSYLPNLAVAAIATLQEMFPKAP